MYCVVCCVVFSCFGQEKKDQANERMRLHGLEVPCIAFVVVLFCILVRDELGVELGRWERGREEEGMKDDR